MTHAGHRAYKKVDQRNRPCDLIYGLFSEYVCNDGCLLESLRTKLSCDELECFFELTTDSNKSN